MLSVDYGRFSGEPWFDVTEYGATGDGSTDDYPAIQEAVNASRDAGENRVVYFPEPDNAYLVNDKITWGNDQLLFDPCPWDGATIRAGADLDAPVFGNGAQFENVMLWGLEIDGSGGWTNQSYSPGHKAIAANPGSTDDDTRGLSIEYCYVHDTRATGIGCDSIPQLEIRHNILENCGTDGQTTGSNGIGTGVGELTGYCPMWMEIEQTGIQSFSGDMSSEAILLMTPVLGSTANSRRGLLWTVIRLCSRRGWNARYTSTISTIQSIPSVSVRRTTG